MLGKKILFNTHQYMLHCEQPNSIKCTPIVYHYVDTALCPDIPVFPTVTAIVTLDKYERKTTPTSKFLIPRDYKKVSLLR